MNGVEHASLAMIVLLLLFLAPVPLYVRRARQQGDRLYVRRISGVDAVEEAVGYAAEQGRPTSFSTGLTAVSPVLYACLGVLYYVARKAAQFRSKFLVPQFVPEAMAIVEDVTKDAYSSVGRLSSYDPHSIVFLSEEQFAFASGYIGLVHREQVGSAFLFGSFAAEALILAEAGQQVGAMQVAASVSPEQVAFFICACDYTLIGEELFATSAYLSREPVQLGSLIAQDRAKAILLLCIVLGVFVATWNQLGFFGIQLPPLEALLGN